MIAFSKSAFAATALLCFAAFAACADGDDPSKEHDPTAVSCDEDASQPKCTTDDVSCDDDPNQSKCTPDDVPCAVDYTQPKCFVKDKTCEEDPTQAKCASGEKSCVEDPTQPKCYSEDKTCEEDPTQTKCDSVVTPFCERAENKGKPGCKRDEARDGKVYSYVNTLALPGEDDDCCWDYTAGNNNDPDDYDNALGPILDLVGDFVPDINIDELLADLFEDGDLTLIFEHTDFPKAMDAENLEPGAFDMALFIGEIPVGEDELPLVSADDRMAGKGIFTLGDKLATINGAFVRRNEITADTNLLNLSLEGLIDGDDLDGLGLPNPIKLPLSSVRLRFDVEELKDGDDVLGIKTTDDAQGNLITEKAGKSINFLSGVIEGKVLVDLLNPVLVGLCDLEEGSVAMTFDGTKGAGGKEPNVDKPVAPLIGVNQDVFDAMVASDDSTCKMIGGLGASIGGIVGGFFDVDTNRNGVTNGISLGLNLGFTGATVE